MKSWIDKLKRCKKCGVALDLYFGTLGENVASGSQRRKCTCDRELADDIKADG